MHILIVSDFKASKNSGAAGSLIKIGEQLSNIGCKVDYLWSPEKRLIKTPNFFRLFELPYRQYKQIFSYLRNEEKVDAIIVSQPFVGISFKLLKMKYPQILFINRTHGWESRIEFMDLHQNEKFEFSKFLKRKLTKICLSMHSSLTVKLSDAVICASSSDSEYLINNYPKFSKKIKLIKYGIDEDYRGIKMDTIKNDRVKFLFVGQYVIRKGINDLVTIFKDLKKYDNRFSLTFIINKDSVEKAQQDFSFLSEGSLNVFSWKSREELIELYTKHDVFLMPSYGEGFGKTTLEAMACRLLVLGYNEGSIKDYCIDGVNAMVVEPGNLVEYTKRMTYLINDIDNYKKVRDTGYSTVQNRTWKDNAQETIELMQELKGI